jgi:hypothetical protein
MPAQMVAMCSIIIAVMPSSHMDGGFPDINLPSSHQNGNLKKPQTRLPGRRNLSETTKTTLRLPRQLVKQLKHLALETDRSLQDLATEALQEYLRRHEK